MIPFDSHFELDPDLQPRMELWLDEDFELIQPLPLTPHPPGPWRSLGRYLDYTHWSDRERFRELDRAIQAQAEMRM